MWKMLFSTVWLGRENGEDRKPGKKCGEKSVVKALLHKYPVSLSSHSYKHNKLSLKHL